MILTDEQDEANNLAIINNTIQVRKEVPRATSMRAQRQTGERPLLVPGTWRGKNECGSNGQMLPLTIYTPWKIGRQPMRSMKVPVHTHWCQVCCNNSKVYRVFVSNL